MGRSVAAVRPGLGGGPGGPGVWRPIVTTSATLSEWEVDTYLGLVTGDLAISADDLEAALSAARQVRSNGWSTTPWHGEHTPSSGFPWTWSRLPKGSWCRPQAPRSLSRRASDRQVVAAKGRSRSGRGSPGSPRILSPMMFFCTSSVPPPMRSPGVPRKAGQPLGASAASGEWQRGRAARARGRASLRNRVAASLTTEPSGPELAPGRGRQQPQLVELEES